MDREVVWGVDEVRSFLTGLLFFRCVSPKLWDCFCPGQ